MHFRILLCIRVITDSGIARWTCELRHQGFAQKLQFNLQQRHRPNNTNVDSLSWCQRYQPDGVVRESNNNSL